MIEFETLADLHMAKLSQQAEIFAENVNQIEIVVNNLILYCNAVGERLHDFGSLLKEKSSAVDMLAEQTAQSTKELLRLLNEAGIENLPDYEEE